MATENTFVTFEQRYLEEQRRKQEAKRLMLKQEFENHFQVSFDGVVSVEELCNVSFDDGMRHYVDLNTRNVYSYDFQDGFWLPVNEERDVVLGLLDEEGVA